MRPRTLSAFKLAHVFTLFGSLAAHAHPGHYHPPTEVDEFDSESFMSAIAHPFTGLDHLVVALAIGALAFLMGKRLGAAFSALFMSALAMGFFAGKAGLVMPMLEQGLALSVFGVGSMLINQKMGSVSRFGIAAMIGILHGNAHGLEMSNTMLGLGLGLGTVSALLIGVGTAQAMTLISSKAVRYAGGAVAITGLVLCAVRLA
jgi:urease accessory protein